MSIQKHWLYKGYDSQENYLGIVPNVQGDFVLNQDINSAGPTPITVRIKQSGEVASNQVQYIVTEDEDFIAAEDGRLLTTSGEESNYGVDGALIKNGNIIKVYEYSQYHPNGVLVYMGRVKRWKVKYGANDEMQLYVKPLSLDVNNHLVKGPEILGISRTAQDSSYALYGGSAPGQRKFGAIFYEFPATTPNVSSVRLRLASQSATPTTVSVRMYSVPSTAPLADYAAIMNNVNNALGSADVVVSSTTPAEYTLTFPIPVATDSSLVYAFGIDATGSSGTGALVYYSDANVYPDDGAVITDEGGGGSWKLGAAPGYNLTSEAYLKLYYIPEYTNITLTDFVASDMLKTILNNYISEGGIVTYEDANIGNTGESIPAMTFSVNTVLEGINAMLDFAPRNWYFTIDPGTNSLTFDEANTTTADHVLTFKRQIHELELTASTENVKNKVYFTGGDTGGGENLFILEENADSIDEFGTEIDRITDIRITNTAAGTSKATKHLDKNDDETYETPLRIPDNTMDITLFKPGQTIGFQGFDSTVDSLILPIVRIERHRDYVDLMLGAIPYRESFQIQQLEDQLLGIQTIDNPQAPS